MADPLATIDAWGSPSASVSQFPAANTDQEARTSHNEANAQQEEDDDDAPLSSAIHRAKDAYTSGPAPAIQRTQSSMQQPFLKVRITGLERNRKDLLIRFDANTNLPNFRTNMYRNMQRSYVEFQVFADHLAYGNPQSEPGVRLRLTATDPLRSAILPALPLPQTSAITDDEDDRLVRIALQRWFTRVCEDPVLQQDNEMRSFVESDFGYQPVVKNIAHRATSSTSGGAFSSISRVFRKGPPDENEDLQMAKAELAKLEDKWAESAKAVAGTSKSRRALAPTLAEVGSKMVSLASVESNQDLAIALRRLGKTWEAAGSIAQAQAISDNIILSDSLGYQSLHARQAKDTLIHRTQVLEDAQTASKNAIHKRRAVEKLRGNTRIDPSKVDDAIEEMREAQELDETLARRVFAISTNLRSALQVHSRQAHDDAALMLIEHAKSKIMYEKQLLKELEAVRPEVGNIGRPGHEKQKYQPVSNPGVARSASGTGNGNSIPPTNRPRVPNLTTDNVAQSMFIPPSHPASLSPTTQPRNLPQAMSAQSAYPYQSGAAPTPTAAYNPYSAQPPPVAGGMTQSMYYPGAAAQQAAAHAPGSAYGGNVDYSRGTAQPFGQQRSKLDERVAARSLANMF